MDYAEICSRCDHDAVTVQTETVINGDREYDRRSPVCAFHTDPQAA